MGFIEYMINIYGDQILMLVLTAFLGSLGYACKQLYARHINDDTKRAVAKTVVRFVEQVWKELHGLDKLRKALETAEAMLKKRGIDWDAEEMMVLIEAAVAEFNEAFKKPIDSENADASRITEE
jgi:hypothetical protein